MHIDQLDIRKRPLQAIVENLVVTIQSQQVQIDLLLEQLGEANLRIHYVMDAMHFARRSPFAVDLSTPPVVKSLYELYMDGERERFLIRLQEESDAREALRQNSDAATHAGASGANGDSRHIDHADHP